ncbi:MAG: single-stranded-DNA-specific exonuclease RecJ [Oscillospiraceae bacterium]|nr:single-stranded-DNA-specific exonuclease RecJ [Oscillospiraceae bacterium]
MKYANWKVPAESPVIPSALVSAGCTPLLAAILHLRGLSDAEEAREFLHGGAELLADPLGLADMIPAVQRLARAVAAREHVAVYGDYDVDGITAGCLLADYLRGRGLPCELYIPDRLSEGYGMNARAIDALGDMGVTLIITVDCGVTNVEETAYAAARGIDMIITDHHECRDALPEAEAVVDPKRPDNGPEGQMLAGVGVAFKLVCAMDGDAERMLERYGDLVAVGTVADVMPILGENRFITRYGLQQISQGRCRPGFRALLEEAGAADKRLTAATVGYSLAPRINAAGRLGEVDLAIRLLETENEHKARECARALCQRNQKRQELEKSIWDQAVAMLGPDRPETPIVLAAEGWHPGVIGIVASRLTDAYSVPAVMVCLDGDTGKGSCRSVGTFNLFEALASCADCLEGFGGHAMAAGITVRRDRVDELRQKLGEFYMDHPDRSVPALEADLRVDDPALLSMKCVESLDALEPCGNANPRPLLYMEDVLVESVNSIGRDKKHIRLRLQKFGQKYDAVFFSQTAAGLGIRAGEAADVVFAPQINDYWALRSVQLVITDMRPHGA